MDVWNTTLLLTEVRDEAALETSVTDALILRHATRRHSGIGSLCRRNRMAYMTAQQDYTVAAAATGVRIPYRAQLAGVKTVTWVTAEGSEFLLYGVASGTVASIHRAETPSVDIPDILTAEENRIRFVRTPLSAGTLRIVYWWWPGKLVVTTAARVIDSLSGDDAVVLSSALGTVTTGTNVDIIKVTPPHEYVVLSDTNTDVTSATVTLSDRPATVEAGDWLAVEGESPFVQLPQELCQIFVRVVGGSVLRRLGYRVEGAEMLAAALGELSASLGQYSHQVEDIAHPISVGLGSPWVGDY